MNRPKTAPGSASKPRRGAKRSATDGGTPLKRRNKTIKRKKKTVKGGSRTARSESGKTRNPHAEEKTEGTNVNVVLRCRPSNATEKAANAQTVVNCVDCKEIVLSSNHKNVPDKRYTFDTVYNQFSTQEDVFSESVQPLIDQVLEGYNCTVFAYGQTGTGKTYTMEGKLSADQNEADAGIIPRSVHSIFENLDAKFGIFDSKEYSVKVSHMELYNEELSDLLSNEDRQLRIYEQAGPGKGMIVNNLEEVIVHNASEVFQILGKSSAKRQVAETKLNKVSSRSHCVFTITVHTKEPQTDGEDVIRTGKLHLVDLAGSECIGRSGAQNKHAKEAGKINQSLLTLGRVINALVDRTGYIPYRDSKLTRLLQESLGGRSKTVIIATIGPSSLCIDETISTLDYAQRAKFIQNRPQINQKMTRQAYMRELLLEITKLKQENEACRTKNGLYVDPDEYEKLNSDLETKTKQVDEFESIIHKKIAEYQQLQATFKSTSLKLDQTTALQEETQANLASTRQKLDQTNTKLENTVQEKEETEHVLKDTHSRWSYRQHDFLTTCDQKKKIEFELAQTQEVLDGTCHMLDKKNTEYHQSQLALEKTEQVLHAREKELDTTEVNLMETQHIVQEHVKNEDVLIANATDVKTVLDGVIVDKNLLHDKIARKEALLSQNKQAAHQMERESSERISAMKQDFAQFCSQHEERMTAFSAQLSSFNKSEEESFTQMQSYVEESVKKMEQVEEVTIDKLSKNYDNLIHQQGITNNERSEHHEGLMDQVKQMFDSIKSAFSMMQGQLTQQHQQIQEWHDSNLTTLSSSMDSVKAYGDAVVEQVTKMTQIDTTHAEQEEKERGEMSEMMERFKQSHKKQTQQKMDSLVQNIGKLLSQFQQSQVASVTSAMDQAESLIKQQQDNASERHATMNKLAQAMTSKNANFVNLYQQHHEEYTDLNTAQHKQSTESINSIETGVEEANSNVEKQVDAYTQQTQEVHTFEQTVFEAFQASIRQAQDTNKECVRAQQEARNEFNMHQKENINKMKNDNKQHLSECEQSIETFNKETNTYREHHTQQADELAGELNKFITKSLSNYKPTNETPARVEFEYPQEFAATEDHKKLASKWRESMADELEQEIVKKSEQRSEVKKQIQESSWTSARQMPAVDRIPVDTSSFVSANIEPVATIWTHFAQETGATSIFDRIQATPPPDNSSSTSTSSMDDDKGDAKQVEAVASSQVASSEAEAEAEQGDEENKDDDHAATCSEEKQMTNDDTTPAVADSESAPVDKENQENAAPVSNKQTRHGRKRSNEGLKKKSTSLQSSGTKADAPPAAKRLRSSRIPKFAAFGASSDENTDNTKPVRHTRSRSLNARALQALRKNGI